MSFNLISLASISALNYSLPGIATVKPAAGSQIAPMSMKRAPGILSRVWKRLIAAVCIGFAGRHAFKIVKLSLPELISSSNSLVEISAALDKALAGVPFLNKEKN